VSAKHDGQKSPQLRRPPSRSAMAARRRLRPPVGKDAVMVQIRRNAGSRTWHASSRLCRHHPQERSEYPAVIIPVLTQHYAMLRRNLLYTGGTRGKRLLVLVGQKKAIAIAVRNVSGRRRWSKLDEWLRRGASRAAPTATVAN
jgi:hypothetical protein